MMGEEEWDKQTIQAELERMEIIEGVSIVIQHRLNPFYSMVKNQFQF
jgi:hypothetical protein